jgi:hypothetical protein
MPSGSTDDLVFSASVTSRATRADNSYFDEEHLMLDLDAPLADASFA